MSMYKSYTFDVIAIHPSGFLSYQSGHASTQRKFQIQCRHAEEFALRLLGKFYTNTITETELTPVIPAPFPFDTGSDVPMGYGRLNMVATGFVINPLCSTCFNIDGDGAVSGSGTEETILNPTSNSEMEYYFYTEAKLFSDPSLSNDGCLCEVVVTYEENPCDCLVWDWASSTWSANEEILAGTCVSIERNPAYEMFTLPNANLVWKNLFDPQGNQERLKADSYAYQVIPKADVIVHWHNVPIKFLGAIEAHLRGFRGTVNDSAWYKALVCPRMVGEEQVYDNEYEAETLLFIDWQEDRSRRTDAFGDNLSRYNMNTTTLNLHFKQKRIEIPLGSDSLSGSTSDDDTGIAGWNHMFTDNDIAQSSWMRVVVRSTQEPIFPLADFSTILNPTLP